MRVSRNFRVCVCVCVCWVGGGGVQVSLAKKSLTTFFVSPQPILQKAYGQFQRNLSFSKVTEGSNIFQGVPTLSRGVQLLFPYRNPYNL